MNPDVILETRGLTKEFKGKKNVVLYFYPKDNTPGCTEQAMRFRNTMRDFETLGAVVCGVSAFGFGGTPQPDGDVEIPKEIRDLF